MLITLENERLCVKINSKGAELWSLVDKKDGVEHLWQGDPDYWSFRAPTLFPYCGRLRENSCYLDGKRYESMGMHGFARDFEHMLVEQKEDRAAFCLRENGDTLERYPFSFALYTIYTLEENRLVCAYRVENLSQEQLPFSIGYHTGYRVPFDGRHTVEDYSLVFEKEEQAREICCKGLLTGEERPHLNGLEIPIHDGLFPDSFILTGLKSRHVGIVERDTGREVRVWAPGFPYVVFWSTPRKVPFVCIEPWYGLPDRADTDGDFRKKPGLQSLRPGAEFSCSQAIELLGGRIDA